VSTWAGRSRLFFFPPPAGQALEGRLPGRMGPGSKMKGLMIVTMICLKANSVGKSRMVAWFD
jgi:hypothetical protein